MWHTFVNHIQWSHSSGDIINNNNNSRNMFPVWAIILICILVLVLCGVIYYIVKAKIQRIARKNEIRALATTTTAVNLGEYNTFGDVQKSGNATTQREAPYTKLGKGQEGTYELIKLDADLYVLEDSETGTVYSIPDEPNGIYA
eukprot:m.138284 g.138284  ORF g.138284 m.138284 type:complete len:144 (+) comp14772_c0_seq4:114-545(+)